MENWFERRKMHAGLFQKFYEEQIEALGLSTQHFTGFWSCFSLSLVVTLSTLFVLIGCQVLQVTCVGILDSEYGSQLCCGTVLN